MRYDLSATVDGLDPQFSVSEDAKLIIRNTFEGLFAYDGDGEAIPAAAERYAVSDDGLTWTITLREGMEWLGTEEPLPITAEDFRFALQRLFNPDYPSPFAAEFTCIKNARAVLSGAQSIGALGVRAPDARTLVIELEYPASYLPELLCSSAAMPCNEAFFTETRGRYGLDEEMLLFNGAFYVRFWEPGKYVQVRRNERYHQAPLVAPARVTMYFTPRAEQYDRLRQGKTDAAVLSYDDMSKLDARKFYHERFEDTVWVLALNQSEPASRPSTTSFFASLSARRAVLYALDHNAFASFLGNDLVDTNTLLPPSLRLHGESFRQLAGFERPSAFDPSAARAQWSAAVAEMGHAPPFTLLAPDMAAHQLTAGALQKLLRDNLSLTVGIRKKTMAEVEALVRAGDYQLALLPLRPGSQRPEEMLGDFRSDTERNFVDNRDQAFDALLDRAAAAHTSGGQLEAYAAAEERLLTNAVVIPLYFQTNYYVANQAVSGIHFSPFAGEISFRDAVIK